MEAVLIQEINGKEQVAFYLSKRLLDAETRYSEMERLCLYLYFTCTKLRHYLLNAEIHVICKADVIKHMISAPILKGRLGKWMYALAEFNVRYQPARVVKGQALADLITERLATPIDMVGIRTWVLYFDGSVWDQGCGIGLQLISPKGTAFEFSIQLPDRYTNNETEYQAVLKGLQLLLEAGAEAVEIFGDSKVVINQLTKDYNYASHFLYPYFVECQNLMAKFRFLTVTWIPREQNCDANILAQIASGYIPSEYPNQVEILVIDAADWRADLINYLKEPARGATRQVRNKALRYALIGDDLYFRTLEDLLLKCVGPTEAKELMHDVHEGTCGTHQSAHKMKWLIRRSGYYWPSLLEDCFKYYRGCQQCQKFGPVQLAPASALNPIIKPCPFRGWGLDMIEQVNPPTSKGHKWILAAMDYFTKWVEAVPMKTVTAGDVVRFVKEHIIHKFGIPQSITTDQGTMFMAEEFKQFARDMGITLMRSSLYYAQANGQAEAFNKSLIKLIKRKINEHPRKWHDKLAEALWAYRISYHGSTKNSLYQLVYDQ